ncbi:MAG: hypothetical protein RSD22_01725 [Romboutsia sp.]
MAKKRKMKPGFMIAIILAIFFLVYFIFFNIGQKLDKQPDQKVITEDNETEDTRTLIVQVMSKKKIYLTDESNKDLSGVKIEEDYWDEIKYAFNQFSDIRKPDKYTELYSGYSDDGIRFSTDLNVFRVYTVNKEEYYKIPVSSKVEFENIIKKSIYTSFDFAKQYKSWEKVKITSSTGEAKTIKKWKYDDFSYKMASKRMVGKVQPEKSMERSKYNFAIDISGKGYELRIETMGKDYVKITSNGSISYYEVHIGMFEYLKDEVFKIE